MAIVRRAKKAPYYRCDTPNSLPDTKCCRDKIYEQEITDAVTEAIRMQARCAVEAGHIMEARRKQHESGILSMRAELRNLQVLRGQITEQNRGLYEAFVDGKLNRDIYITKEGRLTAAPERNLRKDGIRGATHFQSKVGTQSFC